MNMKNMKTMSFLRNLSKFFLVATTLTLGCMPAFAEFTKVRSDNGWNGKVTKLDVIGDYYQFTLDKFRGEIVIETDIEADTIYLPNYNNTKGWVLENDKAVKVQINNETSGFLCVSYDRPTNSVSVAYGSCSGTIDADKDRVCKTTGGDVKFKVLNGDASASKRWGLLSYDGKDTTWLSTYNDRDSFVYTVTDSIVMLLKYTTSSGLVSYSSAKVGLSLADCGYKVTSSVTNICPGDPVVLTSNYTEGTTYEWRRNNGKVLATTTEPTISLNPLNSTKYKLYVDGLFAGDAEVKVAGCGFYISSFYPTEMCMQDSNSLVAIGEDMLPDLGNNVFDWQVSEDGELWTTIKTNASNRLNVFPTEDRYYRAVYNKTGQTTSPFFYEAPNCEDNGDCRGLQTRTLFYESFGYFIDEHTYVSDKDVFVNDMTVKGGVAGRKSGSTVGYAGNYSGDNSGVDYMTRIMATGNSGNGSGYYSVREDRDYGSLNLLTEGTTTYHIEKYIAPDPNGYVVPATTFTRLGDGKSNQFVGTDGHLYLQANPVLPEYTWTEYEGRNRAYRLQDGYYAIVANPDSVDHHDGNSYVDCTDNTGNVNGAMLFVNCGETSKSKAAIYAQRVHLGCPADRFAFSMAVKNATAKRTTEDGTPQNPINVSVYLLKDQGSDELPGDYRTMGSVPAASILNNEIESGDIPAGSDEWHEVNQYVQLDPSQKVQSLWVVLYNNGPSGNGNDLLLDDISFSVCLPKAELSAKVGGELITGALTVCDGSDVELVAKQKGDYIQNPVYLFQYYDNDTQSWEDMRDYSDVSTYKKTTATISVTDPRFVGDVQYRVIIGSSVDELRDVELHSGDVCNEFLVATSDIDIKNTYGGPMCGDNPEEKVCFVVDDTVTVTGCRQLTRSDHTWKMYWMSESGQMLVDTMEVTGVDSDQIHFIIDRDYNVKVFDRNWNLVANTDSVGMSQIIFGGIDEGGCTHQQKFSLVAKHVVNLNYNESSTIGCDSVLVQIYKDVPEAGLKWEWGIAGREVIINDTARVFYPYGLSETSTISDTLYVSVINDGDQFCAPADPMKVPFRVNNVSYGVSVVPSSNPICVTPGQNDDDVLMELVAHITPTKATDIITVYNWRLDFGNGDVVDTTSSDTTLRLRYRDLVHRTGRQMTADIISTETVDCGTISNNDSTSKAGVDIREGALSLLVSAENDKICLNSTDTITLKATISPITAMTNLSYFTLCESRDSVLGVPTVVTDSSYTIYIDKTNYPNVFKPGSTKYYSIRAYDKYCSANSNSPSIAVFLNGYDFNLSDEGKDNKECLAYGEKLVVTAGLTDPNAAKLIKSYKWYKDGEFVGGSGLSHSFVVGESSNSFYKLVASDDICDDVADSLQIAVSIKYKTSLSASKLTTCQADDSATVHVSFSPATSILQVKQFEWHAVIGGKDTVMYTGNHADSVLVINSERFPWLVRAGVNAKIYLITRDSICDEVKSDGELDFRFNSPYEMLVDYNGSSVCVPSDKDIDPDTILLRVRVRIEPAEADGQVSNFIWHYKAKDETFWNVINTSVNHLEMTYNDLKGYKGKDIDLYVTSYDDICASGNAPQMSDTVKIEIRVGGFKVSLADMPDAYCVKSLDDASFLLKALVIPSDARNNVSKFYWYDNGVIIDSTEADSIILNKDNYIKAFSAGYTANFSVSAYDSHCELDTVRSDESWIVRFNTPFTLMFDIPSHKICLPPASEEAVTLSVRTEPADAQKQIQEYIWKRTTPSLLSTTTTSGQLNLLEANWLSVSDRMYFTVTAYDNICYNEANGGAGKEDSFMVNQNFVPTLSVDDHYMCSVDDKVEVTVAIDPQESFVKDYTFYYMYKGERKPLKAGDLYKNVFSSSDPMLPADMKAGDVLDFFVSVDDGGVCGPIESDRSVVYVQTPYELTLTTDKQAGCVNGDVTFAITAIDPDGSERFIKQYIWYDGTTAIDGISKLQKSYTTKSMTVGKHNVTVVSVDSICPNVTSNAQDVVINDSLRVTLTPSTYTYCYPNDGYVKLNAQVTTGTPVRYELYDAVSGTRLKSVPNSAPLCTFEGCTPTETNNSYFVRVFDDVCSYDEATAAFASTSINVHVPVNFEVQIKDGVKDVCVGDSIELSLIPVSGSPTYYYVYGKSSETVERIVAQDTTVFYDVAQKGGYLNYTVVAIDEICPNSSESNGSVFVHESPVIQLYANKENVIIGADIELYADPEVGSPTTYEWFCDGRSFDVTSVNRTTYLPESTSEYSVVASDGVCPSASSSIVLEVKLPTAFTPYVLDGYNDTFMRGFTVMVFDRYGQKIFEGDNGWYGQKGDSKEFVDPGVYFYKVVMKNGRVEKGTVEVVFE